MDEVLMATVLRPMAAPVPASVTLTEADGAVPAYAGRSDAHTIDRAAAATWRPLSPDTAVGLVVWAQAQALDGAIGTHRQLVERLLDLTRRGIPMGPLGIMTDYAGRPRSAIVSLALERLMEDSVIKRLAVPLQVTPWGLEHLSDRVATRLRQRHQAPAIRAALTLLGLPEPVRRPRQAPAHFAVSSRVSTPTPVPAVPADGQ